jgi:hypothetical protein
MLLARRQRQRRSGVVADQALSLRGRERCAQRDRGIDDRPVAKALALLLLVGEPVQKAGQCLPVVAGIERQPKVVDAAEVVKRLVVQRLHLSGGDVDGHGASLRSGTEKPNGGPLPNRAGYRPSRIEADSSAPAPGRVSAAGAFHFERRRWTSASSQGLGRASAETHVAPDVAPAPFSASDNSSQKRANPLPKRVSANAPDRIRTCDLRFRRPNRWIGWAMWGTVSSGFS